MYDITKLVLLLILWSNEGKNNGPNGFLEELPQEKFALWLQKFIATTLLVLFQEVGLDKAERRNVDL